MAGIEGQVRELVTNPLVNPEGKVVLVFRANGETNSQLRQTIEAYDALIFGKSDRQALLDLLRP